MTIRIEILDPENRQLVLKGMRDDPNGWQIQDWYSHHEGEPVMVLNPLQPRYFQIWMWNGRHGPPVATGYLYPDIDGGQIKLKDQNPITLNHGDFYDLEGIRFTGVDPFQEY